MGCLLYSNVNLMIIVKETKLLSVCGRMCEHLYIWTLQLGSMQQDTVHLGSVCFCGLSVQVYLWLQWLILFNHDFCLIKMYQNHKHVRPNKTEKEQRLWCMLAYRLPCYFTRGIMQYVFTLRYIINGGVKMINHIETANNISLTCWSGTTAETAE